MLRNRFELQPISAVAGDVFADGTDEDVEGEWKFLATWETPYLPFGSTDNAGDTDKNCALFSSASLLYDVSCDQTRESDVVYCESEGTSLFFFSYQVYS